MSCPQQKMLSTYKSGQREECHVHSRRYDQHTRVGRKKNVMSTVEDTINIQEWVERRMSCPHQKIRSTYKSGQKEECHVHSRRYDQHTRVGRKKNVMSTVEDTINIQEWVERRMSCLQQKIRSTYKSGQRGECHVHSRRYDQHTRVGREKNVMSTVEDTINIQEWVERRMSCPHQKIRSTYKSRQREECHVHSRRYDQHTRVGREKNVMSTVEDTINIQEWVERRMSCPQQKIRSTYKSGQREECHVHSRRYDQHTRVGREKNVMSTVEDTINIQEWVERRMSCPQQKIRSTYKSGQREECHVHSRRYDQHTRVGREKNVMSTVEDTINIQEWVERRMSCPQQKIRSTYKSGQREECHVHSRRYDQHTRVGREESVMSTVEDTINIQEWVERRMSCPQQKIRSTYKSGQREECHVHSRKCYQHTRVGREKNVMSTVEDTINIQEWVERRMSCPQQKIRSTYKSGQRGECHVHSRRYDQHTRVGREKNVMSTVEDTINIQEWVERRVSCPQQKIRSTYKSGQREECHVHSRRYDQHTRMGREESVMSTVEDTINIQEWEERRMSCPQQKIRSTYKSGQREECHVHSRRYDQHTRVGREKNVMSTVEDTINIQEWVERRVSWTVLTLGLFDLDRLSQPEQTLLWMAQRPFKRFNNPTIFSVLIRLSPSVYLCLRISFFSLLLLLLFLSLIFLCLCFSFFPHFLLLFSLSILLFNLSSSLSPYPPPFFFYVLHTRKPLPTLFS